MPATPIGKVPSLRVDATGARLAATSPTFRAAWGVCRATIRLGTPSALTGSSKPKSTGYMGQFDAALAWLLESIGGFGVDTAAFTDPRELARPDLIMAASKAIADAYDKDGELLDEDVAPRLSLRSLRTTSRRSARSSPGSAATSRPRPSSSSWATTHSRGST